ncbi:MAG: hypothetical protein LBB89_01895 [Treponema sp.]|jgi:hypothetical protein|nr:hypothetical protein [Treponema sp.]
MELHITRHNISVSMDFTRKGIISRRPLTEYLQYLNILPEELKHLSNKQILLVGGGVSPVRSWLEAVKINAAVTNLDFFFDADDKVSHNHISEDFYKWEAPADFYHEIWALHSLPLYALSCLEVELFFAKSLLMLAPGGNLRVFPINDGNLDAMFNTKNFYGHAEKAKNSHKVMMDMGKIGFSTRALKNNLVSVADQMDAAKGTDSPYAWFYETHQRQPWANFALRRDLQAAKLRSHLFHIAAPLSKGKANKGLTAYIESREPKGQRIEVIRHNNNEQLEADNKKQQDTPAK